MTATDEHLLAMMGEGTTLGHVYQALVEAGAEPEAEFRDGLHGPDAAVFGQARTYRYLLTRRWAPGPVLTWCMLNPSIADAFFTDATVSRCVRRAVRAGYGGITVVNLFGLRSTDPAELRRHPDPVGVGNDICLRMVCATGGAVVAAWGACGWNARARDVARLIADAGCQVLCLGVTKDGCPRHPLYVRNAAQLQPWGPA